MIAVKLFSAIAILAFAAAETTTTLHFYMHDNIAPPNKTALMVTGPGASSNFPGFGTVTVIDDAMTQGPQQSSPAIGRAQGTWIVSSMDASSLLLTFTAVFQTGDFKGSSLSVHGADKTTDSVREIAVIGGTGQFRNARGYATIKTQSFSAASVTFLGRLWTIAVLSRFFSKTGCTDSFVLNSMVLCLSDAAV